MKARTKEIIRDGFGSLVSNASAMRGAKAGPLWLTIVMFFLALLLPIIPIFVQQVNTNGSTFLDSYSYNLDRTVTSTALYLKNTRNVEFGIDANHMLTVREDGNPVNFSDYGSNTAFAVYVNEKTNQYELAVYLSSAETDKQKETFISEINQVFFAWNKLTWDSSAEGVYHPNTIVLFKDGIYVCVYANNSTTVLANSFIGDFKKMDANDNYLEKLLAVEGVAPSMYDNHYTDGVYSNFKKLMDKSYATLKVKNTALTCLIYFGIFFGASLLMALLMFLLTRGKNNPNNYFSFWLCIKIQGRLSFCPGLLAMIVGFFLTSQIPLIMIMLLGLRVMWISMKELRPIQQ